MELGELLKRCFEIFQATNVEELSVSIMGCVLGQDDARYEQFREAVEDLSVDWMQKIFQYYSADRKNKGQDYTPASLASLIGRLSGDANTIIDMCAGSGALTIQKWTQNPSAKYILYEFDDAVIPYLLFNMALRNINCDVLQSDVLQGEVIKMWEIRPGEKYGVCEEVKHGDFANFKPAV